MKSPSQHQKELLAMLKPKSPMKLRGRSLSTNLPSSSTKGKRNLSTNSTTGTQSSSKSKTTRSIHTSPNHTITNFFKKVEDHDNVPDELVKNEISNNITASATTCKKTLDRSRQVPNPSCTITSSSSSSSSCRIKLDSSDSSSNSDLLESDQELAERLQMEYNFKWQKNNCISTNRVPRATNKKKPLQVAVAKNLNTNVYDSAPLLPRGKMPWNTNNKDNLMIDDSNHKQKRKKQC